MDIREFRKLIRKLEREIDSQFRGENSCCGVTPIQCHTLLEIEDSGAVTINKLADKLSLNKSSVSRTVESLLKMGLIYRNTDPDNRRSVLITLSDYGHSTCNHINSLCDNYYYEILNRIPVEKLDIVNETFELLTNIFFQSKKEINTHCQCDIQYPKNSSLKEVKYEK